MRSVSSSRTSLFVSREDETPASSYGYFEITDDDDPVGASPRIAEIRDTITLIGREPACLIRINDVRVSRQHCKIVACTSASGLPEIRVFSVKERSRVIVDGETVSVDGKLIRDGSIIRIVSAHLRWNAKEKQVEAVTPPSQESDHDREVFKTPGVIGTPTHRIQRLASSIKFESMSMLTNTTPDAANTLSIRQSRRSHQSMGMSSVSINDSTRATFGSANSSFDRAYNLTNPSDSENLSFGSFDDNEPDEESSSQLFEDSSLSVSTETPKKAKIEDEQDVFKTPTAPTPARQSLRTMKKVLEPEGQTASLDISIPHQFFETPTKQNQQQDPENSQGETSLRNTPKEVIKPKLEIKKDLYQTSTLTTPARQSQRTIKKVVEIEEQTANLDVSIPSQFFGTPTKKIQNQASEIIQGSRSLRSTPVEVMKPNLGDKQDVVKTPSSTTPARQSQRTITTLLEPQAQTTNLDISIPCQLFETPTKQTQRHNPETPREVMNPDMGDEQDVFKTPTAPTPARQSQRSIKKVVEPEGQHANLDVSIPCQFFETPTKQNQQHDPEISQDDRSLCSTPPEVIKPNLGDNQDVFKTPTLTTPARQSQRTIKKVLEPEGQTANLDVSIPCQFFETPTKQTQQHDPEIIQGDRSLRSTTPEVMKPNQGDKQDVFKTPSSTTPARKSQRTIKKVVESEGQTANLDISIPCQLFETPTKQTQNQASEIIQGSRSLRSTPVEVMKPNLGDKQDVVKTPSSTTPVRQSQRTVTTVLEPEGQTTNLDISIPFQLFETPTKQTQQHNPETPLEVMNPDMGDEQDVFKTPTAPTPARQSQRTIKKVVEPEAQPANLDVSIPSQFFGTPTKQTQQHDPEIIQGDRSLRSTPLKVMKTKLEVEDKIDVFKTKSSTTPARQSQRTIKKVKETEGQTTNLDISIPYQLFETPTKQNQQHNPEIVVAPLSSKGIQEEEVQGPTRGRSLRSTPLEVMKPNMGDKQDVFNTPNSTTPARKSQRTIKKVLEPEGQPANLDVSIPRQFFETPTKQTQQHDPEIIQTERSLRNTAKEVIKPNLEIKNDLSQTTTLTTSARQSQRTIKTVLVPEGQTANLDISIPHQFFETPTKQTQQHDPEIIQTERSLRNTPKKVIKPNLEIKNDLSQTTTLTTPALQSERTIKKVLEPEGQTANLDVSIPHQLFETPTKQTQHHDAEIIQTKRSLRSTPLEVMKPNLGGSQDVFKTPTLTTPALQSERTIKKVLEPEGQTANLDVSIPHQLFETPTKQTQQHDPEIIQGGRSLRSTPLEVMKPNLGVGDKHDVFKTPTLTTPARKPERTIKKVVEPEVQPSNLDVSIPPQFFETPTKQAQQNDPEIIQTKRSLRSTPLVMKPNLGDSQDVFKTPTLTTTARQSQRNIKKVVEPEVQPSNLDVSIPRQFFETPTKQTQQHDPEIIQTKRSLRSTPLEIMKPNLGGKQDDFKTPSSTTPARQSQTTIKKVKETEGQTTNLDISIPCQFFKTPTTQQHDPEIVVAPSSSKLIQEKEVQEPTPGRATRKRKPEILDTVKEVVSEVVTDTTMKNIPKSSSDDTAEEESTTRSTRGGQKEVMNTNRRKIIRKSSSEETADEEEEPTARSTRGGQRTVLNANKSKKIIPKVSEVTAEEEMPRSTKGPKAVGGKRGKAPATEASLGEELQVPTPSRATRKRKGNVVETPKEVISEVVRDTTRGKKIIPKASSEDTTEEEEKPTTRSTRGGQRTVSTRVRKEVVENPKEVISEVVRDTTKRKNFISKASSEETTEEEEPVIRSARGRKVVGKRGKALVAEGSDEEEVQGPTPSRATRGRKGEVVETPKEVVSEIVQGTTNRKKIIPKASSEETTEEEEPRIRSTRGRTAVGGKRGKAQAPAVATEASQGEEIQGPTPSRATRGRKEVVETPKEVVSEVVQDTTRREKIIPKDSSEDTTEEDEQPATRPTRGGQRTGLNTNRKKKIIPKAPSEETTEEDEQPTTRSTRGGPRTGLKTDRMKEIIPKTTSEETVEEEEPTTRSTRGRKVVVDKRIKAPEASQEEEVQGPTPSRATRKRKEVETPKEVVSEVVGDTKRRKKIIPKASSEDTTEEEPRIRSTRGRNVVVGKRGKAVVKEGSEEEEVQGPTPSRATRGRKEVVETPKEVISEVVRNTTRRKKIIPKASSEETTEEEEPRIRSARGPKVMGKRGKAPVAEGSDEEEVQVPTPSRATRKRKGKVETPKEVVSKKGKEVPDVRVTRRTAKKW